MIIMKKSFKLSLVAISFLLAFMPIETMAEKDENAKLAEDIKSLEETNSKLSDEILGKKSLIAELNDTITNLRDSLSIQQDERPVEMNTADEVSLAKEIKALNNDIDDYKATFVEMATNFLYIPYDRISIEEIAIPAFKLAFGSSYYNDYIIRLKLLKNYSADIAELKRFLESSINVLKNTKTGVPPIENLNSVSFTGSWSQNRDLNSILEDLNARFAALNVVISYPQYGDGWEDTFLGRIIKNIERTLSDRNPANTAAKTADVLNNYLSSLA